MTIFLTQGSGPQPVTVQTSATYAATVQWPDGHYVVLVDTPASGLGYEVTSSGLATSPPDNGFGVNATLNSQGYMAVN